MPHRVTGHAIKNFRRQRGITLDELGALLGGVTGPTISRWESGQDIPGPAKVLLACLMFGEQPFQSEIESRAGNETARNLWKLKLSLEDWRKLEAMATVRGYAETLDFIFAVLREELDQEAERLRSARDRNGGRKCRTKADLDEAPKAAEGKKEVRGND